VCRYRHELSGFFILARNEALTCLEKLQDFFLVRLRLLTLNNEPLAVTAPPDMQGNCIVLGGRTNLFSIPRCKLDEFWTVICSADIPGKGCNEL